MRTLFDLQPKSRLERAFEEFHRANPAVYELFKSFTFKVIHRGFKHFSADMVLHRIRWYRAIETTGDTFKLNNNFLAYYARKFMEEHPEHVGFFRTRKVRRPVAFDDTNRTQGSVVHGHR